MLRRVRTANVMLMALGLLPGCAAINEQAKKGWNKAEQGKATLSLDARERWLLGQLFGASLKLDPIRLVYDSAVGAGAPRTLKNTIHLPADRKITDAGYRRSQPFVLTLTHEATHVWQYQNVGLLYIADALYNQGKGQVEHGDRNRAYQYALDASKPLKRYNSEQQAQLIEDYVGLRLYGASPPFCTNLGALGGVEGYLRAAEQLIARDVNRGFRPLDGPAARARISGR